MLKTDHNLKEHPLISIAMTTFNGELFLVEQIESILSQSLSSFEIVICDDCSTDSTIEILKMYEKNPLFKIKYNKKNIGYVKNFEKAITLCSGDYIALCDQDDIWENNKLKLLYENIGNNLCIHSDALLINQEGDLLEPSFSAYSKKLIYPDSSIDLLLNGFVTGCTAMISSNLKKDILPFPNNIDAHDRWIGLVAFMQESITYLDEPTIKYRQHSSNNIGIPSRKDFLRLSYILEYIKSFFGKKNFTKIKNNLEQNHSLCIAHHKKFKKELIKKNEFNKIMQLSLLLKDLAETKKIIPSLIKFTLFFRYYEKNKKLFTRLILLVNFNLRILTMKLFK